MKIKDIIQVLNDFAPVPYQESYDNCGLLTGNKDDECKGVMISLDVTEEVIEEAIRNNCNLIVSHHPIIFKGLKKLSGNHFVERNVIRAIKNDVALFAIHTNLDNIYNGVNKRIADVIGLQHCKILKPHHSQLSKLFTYVPEEFLEKISAALFEAGAGHIGNYDQCSFYMEGTGSFRGLEGSDPFIGKQGELSREKELKLEVIFPDHIEDALVEALIKSHPYEEVAYDIIKLQNKNLQVGSGIVGEFPEPLKETDLLQALSKKFNIPVVKHSPFLNKSVKKIAVCGGSGSFLLPNALQNKADAFITADIKYHDFFEADGKILMADIGHFESEQYTIDLLFDILVSKFTTFAVLKTKINTNAVNYYRGF